MNTSEEIVHGNFTITKGTFEAGRRFWASIQSPQAKRRRSLTGNFARFDTEAERDAYITSWKDAHNAKIEARQAKKAAEKEATAAWVMPYEVGEILYNSWGYDQTNIDFYQIVRTTKRCVFVRPIGQTTVETPYPMQEYVKPVVDNFIGDEVKKLSARVYTHNGILNHHLVAKFGGFTVYDGTKILQTSYA